jgi:hypothetical protein
MGATAGCFGAACAPAGAATIPGSGLTFTGGSFNQADSNGFLAIGSATENFGTLNLSGIPFTYNTLFTLLVNFTLPAGTPGGGTVYSAVVGGSVTNSTTGGVLFDFNNTPQTINYTGGSFTLAINDVSVNSSELPTNTAITGTIRTAVPEPATWALMLLGFGGIGLTMQRRRRPALAQIA